MGNCFVPQYQNGHLLRQADNNRTFYRYLAAELPFLIAFTSQNPCVWLLDQSQLALIDLMLYLIARLPETGRSQVLISDPTLRTSLQTLFRPFTSP